MWVSEVPSPSEVGWRGHRRWSSMLEPSVLLSCRDSFATLSSGTAAKLTLRWRTRADGAPPAGGG